MIEQKSVNRSEILQVADAVAREKNIDREIVIEAMEQAIQKAGRAKYGLDHDIRAHIDRKSGDISLARYIEIVEEVEDEHRQLELKIAKIKNKEAEIGEFIIEALPPIEFGRIAAQTAKQVIIQKVREAERERQYEEYKDKIGEVVNGSVKRMDFGNVIVDLNRNEAFLPRDSVIPRENFQNGERIRAYIQDVKRTNHGPQIYLSRTCPEFMAKLFAQEVPEIYDGIIEIKGVARDPGSRAKIAVYSQDSSLDPVGACVGMRGSRVQAVVNELQGEKIDIVPWSENLVNFVVNAIAPAEVSKVIMNEDTDRLEVVVPEESLSLAIGRRGQNVKLCSILTGCDIDILTETVETERRQEEFKTKSQLFMDCLDVDDVIAHLLVAEGFNSAQEIVDTDLSELERIEGFDADIAKELQSRAEEFLKNEKDKNLEEIDSLGVSDEVANLPGMTEDIIITLGKNKIKKLDDIADLATDELKEILVDFKLSDDVLNEMIMKAREHWFDNDEAQDNEGQETKEEKN